MKRILGVVLAVVLLLLLTACSGKPDITGIWEQEMQISILGEGIKEPTSVISLTRFTFREDGTGLQEHILADDSYPDTVREFAWHLEGDMLTLDFGEEETEKFSLIWDRTSLKLENRRGSYDLTRR